MVMSDYDDTDMSAEEFERRMAQAVPAAVVASPRAGSATYGSSNDTRSESVRFGDRVNETITRNVVLAGE